MNPIYANTNSNLSTFKTNCLSRKRAIRRVCNSIAMLFCLVHVMAGAQSKTANEILPDSLQLKLKSAKTKAEQAKIWMDIAIWQRDRNAYHQAKEAADHCISLSKPGNQKKILADAYNLIGTIYDYEGKISEAIQYYFMALEIRERLGNKRDIAKSLNNLGSANYYIQSFANAETYFNRSLHIFEELNDQKNKAEVYANLGSVKQQLGSENIIAGKMKEGRLLQRAAIDLHKKSKLLYEQIKNETGLVQAYNNLGVVYSDLGLYDSALINHRKALLINRNLQDQQSLSLSYSNLARLYYSTKKTDSAILYAKRAIKLDYQLQSREGLRDDFQTMSEIQVQLKNYKSALDYFKKFVAMSDTLVNQESREKIANYMVQFEFQKQRYSDSLRKSEDKKREGLKMELEEKEVQRLMNIQYSGIVIFIMVVLGSIFLLRRVQLPIIWIEGFIFFSAILVFEFLYLFLDPYIELISGKMPIYKFTINMGLAIAVFYAHSFFEGLLKTKLIKEDEKK